MFWNKSVLGTVKERGTAILEHMQEAEETMRRAHELHLAKKTIQKNNQESK